MVEFAQPNTHKAVHVGHLRNIVLGDAVVRHAARRRLERARRDLSRRHRHARHQVPLVLPARSTRARSRPPAAGRWLGAVYAEADARLEYRKHVLACWREALADPALGPRLAAWLRAHGESDSRDAARSGPPAGTPWPPPAPDPDPETAHEPDEDLGADVDLASINPARDRRLWAGAGRRCCRPTSALRAEYDAPGRPLRLVGAGARLARTTCARSSRRWEAKDPELMALWQRTRQWSLDEFADVFRTLGVRFDVEFYESQVEDEGRDDRRASWSSWASPRTCARRASR